MVEINSRRLMQDLVHMRSIGTFGTGVIRRALSPTDMEARQWLGSRMSEAGLTPSIDGVGNVVGKSSNPGKALLIGSHTDTQPQGGWLDGVLGVIYGLEVVRACAEDPATAGYAIDVASWSDEEGTYLGELGSKSFCGLLDRGDVEQTLDHLTGLHLGDAIEAAGLKGVAPLKWDPDRYRAYLEAHIEQGPHLEAQELLLGVVTAIVGLRTFKLTFKGQQNHAGTTPMEYRKDAAQALIRLAHLIDIEIAGMADSRTVWTIGHIQVEPGSPSVVPGKAEMLLQYRDVDEKLLDELENKIAGLINDFNELSSVDVQIQPAFPRQVCGVMNKTVQKCLAEAAQAHAPDKWLRMPSGAGHDAQIFAPLLPTGMLFIPSIGGISHDIAEDSKEEDIIRGCRALATATDLIFKEEALG